MKQMGNLKESNLGVAQAFLTPKRQPNYLKWNLYFYIPLITYNPNVLPKRVDEHLCLFHMGSSPSPEGGAGVEVISCLFPPACQLCKSQAQVNRTIA